MIQAVKAFREKNPALAIRGIIPCRAQARRRIHGEFLTMMENLLPGCIGPAVRENVALAEAPSSGLPAVTYWPSSNGAHDYRRVSNWLLERLACAPGTPSSGDLGDVDEFSAKRLTPVLRTS